MYTKLCSKRYYPTGIISVVSYLIIHLLTYFLFTNLSYQVVNPSYTDTSYHYFHIHQQLSKGEERVSRRRCTRVTGIRLDHQRTSRFQIDT